MNNMNLQPHPKFKAITDIMVLDNEKPVVYIAGKVSNLDYNQTVKKFEAIALKLHEAGYAVINPMWLVHKDADWKQAMRICISFLPHADFITYTHDWQDSEGANKEKYVADFLGIETLII